MRNRFTLIAILAMMLFFTNCNKQNDLKPELISSHNSSTSLAEPITNNTVVTLAGMPNSPGFKDGSAKTAQFHNPTGIQLMNDGTIYIADYYNNAIRKFTPDGTVTTLKLTNPQDVSINEPTSVGMDNAGILHVVMSLGDDEAGLTYFYDKSGNFITGDGYTYTALGPLAKDPYNDFFWFPIGTLIEKNVLAANGEIGTDDVPYNKRLLFEDETRRGQTLNGLFIGRNRVIYFATTFRLFKYTPGGVTQELYPDLSLGRITSIVLNSDSRTMYLAGSGKIEKIEGGKLTVLAGPNAATPDGRDGVGLKADVNANGLALGDHENSLYFSDTKTHTIRKLMLK